MDIEQSPRGLLTAFFRQSGTFLAVSALILAASLAYVLLTDPVYEARGSMVVKFGQDARPEVSSGDKTGYTQTDADTRQEIIRSYIKLIASHDLLQALTNEYGVYRLYPELEEDLSPGEPPDEVAIKALLEEDLSVNYDETHIIDIAVRNPDPVVASEFAGLVMNAFIRKRTEIYNTPQTNFLKQQIEEAREKLELSQQQLHAFKQETGISAIDEEMAQLLREKSDLGTVAYEAVTQAQSKLTELETQEAEMRSTYRSDSPLLKRLQQIVAVARADLQRRKNDLNPTAGSDSSLAAKMANVDRRLSYLEANRGRFNELQQQVKIDEENYLYYLKRGEEARINNLLNRQNITSITVVDKPSSSIKPVKPQKKLVFAVTLLAAMMAGAGAAISRELLDDRLTNPEQVYSSLGIPVIASFEKGAIK